MGIISDAKSTRTVKDLARIDRSSEKPAETTVIDEREFRRETMHAKGVEFIVPGIREH